jgi:MFS family permease
LLLQQYLGLSPLQAAFTLMPFSLAVIAGSVLSRPLGARLHDRRLCGVGLGGIAAGNLVLAITAGRVAGLVAGAVVAGVGLGIAAVRRDAPTMRAMTATTNRTAPSRSRRRYRSGAAMLGTQKYTAARRKPPMGA